MGILFGGNSVSSDNTDNQLGFTATFMTGYDFQLARHLVLGLDGFYVWAEPKTHDFDACNGCAVDYGSSVYGLTGRIGFPVGERNLLMPYVRVGYGWYNLSGDLDNHDGSLRYGVGLEWMSDTGTVSLVVQYTRQQLETHKVLRFNGVPSGYKVGDITSNVFSIGANFFF